jgi:hypothetical protein
MEPPPRLSMDWTPDAIISDAIVGSIGSPRIDRHPRDIDPSGLLDLTNGQIRIAIVPARNLDHTRETRLQSEQPEARHNYSIIPFPSDIPLDRMMEVMELAACIHRKQSLSLRRRIRTPTLKAEWCKCHYPAASMPQPAAS